MTPFEFGFAVGSEKRAIAALAGTGAAIGGGVGALTSPAGHRSEGAGRGALKGLATGAGLGIGAPLGMLGALGLSVASPRLGRTLFAPSKSQLAGVARNVSGEAMKRVPGQMSAAQKLFLRNAISRGGVAGAGLGAVAGNAAAGGVLGKPSWQQQKG